MLFCLSLLQELIGLNTSLPSLFGLRAGESDLEDLGFIQYRPKTLGKTPPALFIWYISNKIGASAPVNHPLLSVLSLCLCNTWPPTPRVSRTSWGLLSFHLALNCQAFSWTVAWISIKRKMWTYSNLLNIVFSFILGWITTCQKTQKQTQQCSERAKASLGGPMQEGS